MPTLAVLVLRHTSSTPYKTPEDSLLVHQQADGVKMSWVVGDSAMGLRRSSTSHHLRVARFADGVHSVLPGASVPCETDETLPLCSVKCAV